MAIEILDEVKTTTGWARVRWFAYRSYKRDITGKITDDDLLTWEHCRDRVQLVACKYLERNGLYFMHRKNTADNVMRFLHRIETTLKIAEKSKFARTDHDQILWIKLSPFWLGNIVRRSFLTFALRSGQSYNKIKDNFLDCFRKNKYGKDTMTATRLFLKGHTVYIGTPLTMFQGWHRLFQGKGDEEVKQLMSDRYSALTQKSVIW
jgi:hypothetical protein